MSLVKNAKVAVIGSGISSLTFTYFLSKLRPDVQFTIYEKESYTGGYIKSELLPFQNNETIRVEKGPRTLRAVNEGTSIMVDILIKLGLFDKVRVINGDSIANRKYLLSPKDELVEVPSGSLKSMFKFFNNDLTKGLIPSVLKEPFQPKRPQTIAQDESVQSFLTRRFPNGNIGNNIVSAIYHGIYAADINKLSIRSTMSKLVEFEEKKGSILKGILFGEKTTKPKSMLPQYQSLFRSDNYDLIKLNTHLKKFPMILFEDGLSTFTNAVHSELMKNPKVDFKLNSPVKSIVKRGNEILVNGEQSFNHVRSTINVNTLSRALSSSSSSDSSAICFIADKLTYVDIFLVNIYLPKDVIEQKGFGFLVPLSNQNPERLLGVIYDSDIEKSSMKLFQNPKALNDETTIASKYDSSKEYTKLTMMFGGHFFSNQADKIIPSPEQLQSNIKTALKRTLKIDLETMESGQYLLSSTYISQCLPQFHVGYEELSKQFHQELQKEFQGNFSHGGMSFGNGAGVPDCVVNALQGAISLK